MADVAKEDGVAEDPGLIAAAGGAVHWLDVPGGPRLRAAGFPGGERGVALLLNGRTEYIEKHLDTVDALRARGFGVWTLDWRGQGASGRALADRTAHHVGHFDEYLGDANQVLDRLVLPGMAEARRPLVLMGHSMGGLIGAHLLARRGPLFAGGVLSAPMIDFQRGRWGPRWLVRLMVGAMCLLPGRRARFAPGPPRAPLFERAFDGNPLTTDRARLEADLLFLRTNRELAVGGVTWGWLRAALDGVVALTDPRVIARIDMPVLVAMAGDERLVDNRATRRFALRLPRGKLVRIEGARHDLLREADRFRDAFWEAVDGFLEGVV